MKMGKKVDLIFTFRFLLHFHREKREEIYQQALRLLKPDGYLVFEAMNARVVKPLRRLLGNKRYHVYDKLYLRHELIAELDQNGFEVVKLYPVLSHFWIQTLCSRPFKNEKVVRFFERFPSSQPYEWIVLCRKK
jgi:SAM-dependent methyltransferase